MRFSQAQDTKQSPEDSGFYVTVIRSLRDCLCHGQWAPSARAKNALQIGVDLTKERPKIILLVCSVCRICNSILQNSFRTDQAPALPKLNSYIQTGMTSYTVGYGLKDTGSISKRNFFIFPSRSERLWDPSNLSDQKFTRTSFPSSSPKAIAAEISSPNIGANRFLLTAGTYVQTLFFLAVALKRPQRKDPAQKSEAIASSLPLVPTHKTTRRR